MTDDGGVFGSTFRATFADSLPASKLTEKKRARAAERWQPPRRADVAAGGRRIPPGQQVVTSWPVLDLGPQPALDRPDWSLTVGGLVDQPLTWSWSAFQDQPQTELTADIHCVTAWSRLDNAWRGVTVAHLLAQVRPQPQARFVIAKSYDGYATDIALEDFNSPKALIATHWQGEPLTRAHGGPARLVIPRLYFWKSAKWVRHLWFTDRRAPGYWEARGYHHRGDPWKEERYG